MSGRFLPDVPGAEIESILSAAPGNEIAAGKFDSPKAKAKAGFRKRVAVLSRLRPTVPEEVCQIARSTRRKDVTWNDIADALAAVLTASQPTERLRTLPTVTEHDRCGLPMETVYADVLSPQLAKSPP